MGACLNDIRDIPLNNEQNEPTPTNIGETSNEPTQATTPPVRNEFEELLASSNQPLYPGCDFMTTMDFMSKFTHLKVSGKWSDTSFNKTLKFLQEVFPPRLGYNLPPSYYAIKKTFKKVGLGYELIHACENDCFLYRGVGAEDLEYCPVCKTSRWKDKNTTGKKVPNKVLR